jgi:hypothetical protein
MIVSIQMDEYILSSLALQSRSEDQNYGMIITYVGKTENMSVGTRVIPEIKT